MKGSGLCPGPAELGPAALPAPTLCDTKECVHAGVGICSWEHGWGGCRVPAAWQELSGKVAFGFGPGFAISDLMWLRLGLGALQHKAHTH